jgi:hypothetical protein
MQGATIEHEQYRRAEGPGASGFAERAAPFIPRRRGLRTALAWSAAGFLAGALFWHAVGFWRFISDIVLDPAPAPAQMTAVAPPSQVSLPTIYMVDPANCTALILDRKTNSTAMQPCPRNGLALRLEVNGRDSLAVASDTAALVPARYPAN